MKINTKKAMNKAAGASTGIAVAAAFFNVALLVVQLVKTVSESGVIETQDDNVKLEEKN